MVINISQDLQSKISKLIGTITQNIEKGIKKYFRVKERAMMYCWG